MFEDDTTLGYTTLHGQYFDPSLAKRAAGLAFRSISIHHPGEDEQYSEEAYSHTVWLADDIIEVSILIAPLWYVQTHGTPLNWQRLRLLIRTTRTRQPRKDAPLWVAAYRHR